MLQKLQAVDEAIDAGSQTAVGIEMRISHVFAGKTDSELRFIRDEYAYALYLLARRANPPDADKSARYKNPYRRAAITSPNFGGAVPWYGAGEPEM